MKDPKQTGTLSSAQKKTRVHIRTPHKRDGADVWNLIESLKVLDTNSLYCNLLQCTHFSSTCAIAEMEGPEMDRQCVGWISAYRPPAEPDVLFVWQVAVSPAVRGRGIGKRLIQELLERDSCRDVRRIQATITSDKKASWALFHSIAEQLDTPLQRKAHFERETHFDGEYPTEHLVTIGPFKRLNLRQAA